MVRIVFCMLSSAACLALAVAMAFFTLVAARESSPLALAYFAALLALLAGMAAFAVKAERIALANALRRYRSNRR